MLKIEEHTKSMRNNQELDNVYPHAQSTSHDVYATCRDVTAY